ncbi:RND efflux membrane fusion protein [Indibacter alkaliphilus LW1]|jgi:multidrug resistance efflux pump|uniref:RND efflux membrane fusion protein n=1 Tax=Indibacter alkaliphilus (strain CCUG 57479 / KCTC 22604 / LW1) TaxID=1189612 RepID=S2E7N9_INDAL|nr:HlyD family efflux transporter periplasmic adaptor subunit [Indibacter alkaliphilus]EOZ98298.1 RND efflux membrane fusion protein [Indibacter alkaliphilus LW1]
MIDISKNKIGEKATFSGYKSLGMSFPKDEARKRIRILVWFLVGGFLFLFLPWTQNIRSNGFVTALRPDQRPQTVHSIIAGRIENWYVSEGDYVQKGDTVLMVSEIKDDYFDPQLLERTQLQVNAKNLSALSYSEKVKSLEVQIQALKENNVLRKEQAENRLRMAELQVTSDSIRFEQAKVNFKIGEDQLRRAKNLYEEGLRSLTDFEQRELRFQEVQASMIAAENDLLKSQNARIAAMIELNAIDNDFRDRMAKSTADMYEAMSARYDAEATATKLENQYTNYEVRTGFRYILAPQEGYITRAIQVGIGETIKEGAEIISILPANAQLAVEMYVSPVDFPLMRIGNRVRFIFDGWPAIVFSGWPQITNGTFGGVVHAIDNFSGPDGKYRILVVEDPQDKPWPDALRIGSGADGIALLNDVPLWYELWRQLNGFPPDYYTARQKSENRK